MAKKAPAKKAPAKRKPRAKKPVQPDSPFEISEFSPGTIRELRKILDGEKAVIDQAIQEAETHPVSPAKKPSSTLRKLLFGGTSVALLVAYTAGVVWFCGGVQVGPGPSPQRSDVLAKAYEADRITQIAVLRDLAKQPFDCTTDDGRKQAGEWFNAQRFRNRANDFGGYTDRVAEAIATNSEDSLANELEAK